MHQGLVRPGATLTVVSQASVDEGAAQFPSIAGGVPAEQDGTIRSVVGGVLVGRLLELGSKDIQFVAEVNGNMGPGRRMMFRVLAQMDLRSVLAFEPFRLGWRARCQLHTFVIEEVDEERRFGVGSVDGN